MRRQQVIINKYKVKIPKSVSICYCEKRKYIFIKGVECSCLIPLELKLKILQSGYIYVTSEKFNAKSVSNSEKKKVKSLRGTIRTLINKSIHQVSYKFFKKLALVGVGYKAFYKKLNNFNLVQLKLGYSHSLYFKVPKSISIDCNDSTKIFISGNSHTKVTQIASIIRKYKTPEPYKGKGILYHNERINLKQGKKI